MAQIGFHHGALCEPYEQQANEQGYTLGEHADYLQDLGFKTCYLYIHGLLTDSQYDAALKKLQKMLVQSVSPMAPKGVDNG